MNASFYKQCTVVELQELLRLHGLPIYGRKQLLIHRLVQREKPFRQKASAVKPLNERKQALHTWLRTIREVFGIDVLQIIELDKASKPSLSQ